MPPDGCRRPVAAAHAISATPAGSSRHALTNSGLVCGASICGTCDHHVGVHAFGFWHGLLLSGNCTGVMQRRND